MYGIIMINDLLKLKITTSGLIDNGRIDHYMSEGRQIDLME